MWWLYLEVFGSMLMGIVLALVWWFIWGRKMTLPVGSAGGFAVAAGLLALLHETVMRFVGSAILLPFQLPRFLSDGYMNYRFAGPLLIGILGLVLLAFPVHSRGGRGVAELTRRSPVSFARARWFIAPGVVLALILLMSILAGAASQPDPSTGRYTMYLVDLGGEMSMGTSIYGWFYSVPAMILTGVVIMVAITALSLLARPALAEDRPRDIRMRTIRARNIVVAGTGALVIHLSLILDALAGTASIRSQFATSEGPMSSWTSFAALEPSLVTASELCAALGVALWTSVALAAVPAARRASAPVSVGP